jgi:hypothetical protein
VAFGNETYKLNLKTKTTNMTMTLGIRQAEGVEETPTQLGRL